MKKRKLFLLSAVIVLAIGIAIVIRHRKHDFLANFVLYATEDRMMYTDPATSFGPLFMKHHPPAWELTPIAQRTIKLKDSDLKRYSDLLRRDLPEGEGWHFAPPSGVGGQPMIQAYKGQVPGAPVGVADDFITLQRVTSTTYSHPPVTKSWCEIQETHRMTAWDVWLLKITHLGRSPFEPSADDSVVAP
jgi:hypothetical protein